MQYKKIKSKKIYEVVIDELLQMISTGKLKPGDKVDSVQQLAENFQVGRSAIREALSALRVMGLVEMRQGEGTYIKEHDPRALSEALFNTVLMKEEDIRDLLGVRKILEIGAVSTAVQNWTVDDLSILEVALEDMRTAGNEELGEKADFAFHMAIANASQNKLLVHLMSNVSEIMVETMRETRKLWLFSHETTVEKIYQEHQEIFQAIKDKNAPLAQERMLSHLERVEETLLKKS